MVRRSYLRWYIQGFAALVFVLSTAPTRELLVSTAKGPVVQGYLDDFLNRTATGTVALIQYTQAAQQKMLVNGKPSAPLASVNGPVPAAEEWKLKGAGCTFTSGEQVDAILEANGSPAKGYGYAFIQGCRDTGIDNGYVLAMFGHESTYGKYGVAVHTLSSGNIKCTEEPCYQGFQVYRDWAHGVAAHFKLLQAYAEGRGPSGKAHPTIQSALMEWAPPEDKNNQNADCKADPGSYPCDVAANVRSWRKVNVGQFVADGPEAPAQVNKPAGPVLAKGQVFEAWVPMGGCKTTNLLSAYNSSPGLKEFTVGPGTDWSFNATWAVNGDGTLTTCGVYGGGVCSYAAGLEFVARHMGLETQISHHGINFEPGLDWGAQTSIWSSGGRGGQDLVVVNKSNKTAHFRTEPVDGNTRFHFIGWFE